MKPIYQVGKTKVFKRTILGRPFFIMHFSSGYKSAEAPMGDNPKDKAMFDKLVYFNQKLTHGKDEKKIIANIKKFIKSNQ